MPTNTQFEGLFYGLNGIPLFTYGMIGLTSIVLAYFTILDTEEQMEGPEGEGEGEGQGQTPMEIIADATGNPVSDLNIDQIQQTLNPNPEGESNTDSVENTENLGNIPEENQEIQDENPTETVEAQEEQGEIPQENQEPQPQQQGGLRRTKIKKQTKTHHKKNKRKTKRHTK